MNDLISRQAQAAIDEWKNDFKGYVNALNIPRDDYNGIMAYIDELSPAQPEVAKGTNVPTNDCISRQAAINALNDEIVRRRIDEDTNDDGALDEFDTEAILRRLPSAQPEQRWIPVAERLPESSSVWKTEYLATVFCAQWKKKTETMCVQWENTTVRGKRTSRWILNNRLLPKEWKVIAWMPLPKPYEEEKK